MSTKKTTLISPEDWISPAEAARRRGVSRQAITKLMKSGRVAVIEVGGRHVVKLSDITDFKPLKPGRRKTEEKTG